jgi:hypothetical protein
LAGCFRQNRRGTITGFGGERPPPLEPDAVMKGLRIDHERAVKVAAMLGLALVSVSILPGLLRTPEPPPLPPDVGFRPIETGPAAPSASAEPPLSVEPEAGPRVSKRDQKRDRRGNQPPVRAESGRGTNNGAGRTNSSRTNARQGRGGRRRDEPEPVGPRESKAAPAPEPESMPSAGPAPGYSTAPAETRPDFAPPPASLPDDGSQEFAPR